MTEPQEIISYEILKKLQELLNGEDFYEFLRKTPDPEAQAYIDKIWMNAIYGDT